MRWLHNIPFENIPEGFIRQISPRWFSYEDFLKWAPVLNKLDDYWNIIGIDETTGDYKVVCWGRYDPLEKAFEVLRISIHPSLFSVKGNVLKELRPIIVRYAKGRGAKVIYFITDKYKAFRRKLGGCTQISPSRIMEVF